LIELTSGVADGFGMVDFTAEAQRRGV